MKVKKTAILISKQSWFVPYAKQFVEILRDRGLEAELFFKHGNISSGYYVVFILSYPRVINKEFLLRHAYNVVVHGSDLPKGRGWAPLFWQILEGKKKIPIVLFEAAEGVDKGDVYIKDLIIFEGHELCDEIRKKQAEKTIELCLRFLDKREKLKPKRQKGTATYYKKRNLSDSELDINRTLKEQFNLLRIVNNEKFPSFFYYKDNKYILKIYKEKNINKNPKKKE